MTAFKAHGGHGDVTGSAVRATEPLDNSGTAATVPISLEHELAVAERRLISAKMIDNFPRMVRESDEASARVAEIKRRIAERDRAAHADVERDYLRSGVDALGDRYAC